MLIWYKKNPFPIKNKWLFYFVFIIFANPRILQAYLLPCLFLRLDLLKVEFQLLAFQNVAIRATALSGAGGNASWKMKQKVINLNPILIYGEKYIFDGKSE